MDQGKNTTALLVEFDSTKGPVLRKKQPMNYKFPQNLELEQFLMWIIRASEFSVRKIEKHTVYAKNIALRDPNFARKKRQFGIALITETTIELAKAELMLDAIITHCKKDSDGKPYFIMLNRLLEIIGNFSTHIIVSKDDSWKYSKKKQKQMQLLDDEVTKPKENSGLHNKQFLLMSNKLLVFNKVTIIDKEIQTKTIVSLVEGFSKVNDLVGRQFAWESSRYTILVDLQYDAPEGLEHGVDILLRIFEALPSGKILNERLLVAVEFLDRLLDEKVDIEYYLPFLQYLISMDNFTVTEFKTEVFAIQFDKMKETHGEWIKCLKDVDLDGKKLSEYFKVVGVRREGLELLIDLLFVKLIAIF
ncbi:MAG: hypothetical protein FK732_10380 [Asgard group archaeon]|nr:hypothetical protein [Asgard group archaeon]